ncbi:hypothetical protein NFI96_015465, partial [Prochilodus magdalenae]
MSRITKVTGKSASFYPGIIFWGAVTMKCSMGMNILSILTGGTIVILMALEFANALPFNPCYGSLSYFHCSVIKWGLKPFCVFVMPTSGFQVFISIVNVICEYKASCYPEPAMKCSMGMNILTILTGGTIVILMALDLAEALPFNPCQDIWSYFHCSDIKRDLKPVCMIVTATSGFQVLISITNVTYEYKASCYPEPATSTFIPFLLLLDPFCDFAFWHFCILMKCSMGMNILTILTGGTIVILMALEIAEILPFNHCYGSWSYFYCDIKSDLKPFCVFVLPTSGFQVLISIVNVTYEYKASCYPEPA